jgi:hypothetical protein
MAAVGQGRCRVYAIVVREQGDVAQIEGSGGHVSEQVAPRVRQAPGFVSALWMSDGTGKTLNVLAFETEQAARGALEAARRAPRPDYLTLEGAEVYRVLAAV